VLPYWSGAQTGMDGIHMPSLHEISTSGGSKWKPLSHSKIAN